MAAEPAPPRRSRPAASNAMVIAALAIALFSGGRHDATRQLQPVQSLPPDVAAIVEDTWGQFAAAFPARLACMDSVRLELVREVPGGDARYQPADQLIRIEIPTSPPRFRESLAHELAHHLEAVCADQVEVRNAFIAAQGLPANTSWFSGEPWDTIPSEQFAEAVVALVNGERLLHGDLIVIAPETLEVVRAWGTGKSR